MTEWILVVLLSASTTSIHTATGFKSRAACEAAGEQVQAKFNRPWTPDLMKPRAIEFVCAATVKT